MLREQITQLLEQLRNRKTTEKEDEKQSELQLPAMQLLTSKNSVQAFFLRILKVASFCISCSSRVNLLLGYYSIAEEGGYDEFETTLIHSVE